MNPAKKQITTRQYRDTLDNVISDVNLIYLDNTITGILDSLPVIVLILNKYRQIVYCNNYFQKINNVDFEDLIFGLRPGEFFGCAYHNDSPFGCGESERCKYCGAVEAVRESQMYNKPVSKEASLIIVENDVEKALDLNVTAVPFVHREIYFTLVTIQDISHEKRRKALEQLFFQDLIDKTVRIQSVTGSYRSEENPDKALLDFIERLSNELISDILSQRILLNAENNELDLSHEDVFIKEIIEHVCEHIKNRDVLKDVDLTINESDSIQLFSTDRLLLKRVLIQMLKNVVEASTKGDKIKIGGRVENDSVLFSVQNNQVMSAEVENKIFHPSFLIQGVDGGIGTYSLKLFGEQYLKGKFWFESTKEEGTTFFFRLPVNIKAK